MGTTVAGLGLVCIAGSDHWVVFNVGDSRVYRFVGDALVQMTVDHTEVAELVAAGAVAAADAHTHPRRHVVTRALGSDPAPEPDVWVFPPTAGERFLICSDGLFLELSEAEIVDVLRAEPSPQRVADELVRRAQAHGGRDDVDGDRGRLRGRPPTAVDRLTRCRAAGVRSAPDERAATRADLGTSPEAGSASSATGSGC